MTKRLTESQIVGILKEAEAGIPVPEVCRTYGVGQSTFYKWRSRYGSMEASDIRRIKEFEDENRQLSAVPLTTSRHTGLARSVGPPDPVSD